MRILTLLVLNTLAIPAFLRAQSKEPLLLIGTYTQGKSEGVYVYEFNQTDGKLQPRSILKHIINPSFLALSPDQQNLYIVSETAGEIPGRVVAARVLAGEGRLAALNEVRSEGNDPCYVTVDKSGKWVITGNYSSGTLAVLPRYTDGRLGDAVTKIAHAGSGPDKSRQEQAHVHATVLSKDNRYLYVPDLGIDRVMIYAFNEQTGALKAARQPWFQASPGAGPRHLSFDGTGQYAYLLEELTGTIAVLRCNQDDGSLAQIQRISTLPAGFKGEAGSAEILVSPDGRQVYASNRGESNTLAIFQRDVATGKLRLLGHQPTLGVRPRNFNFDPSGQYLLVANQDSDKIVVFRRDPATGLLTDTGHRADIPAPVCLRWVY